MLCLIRGNLDYFMAGGQGPKQKRRIREIVFRTLD
jgi:hypothetical protein